MQTTDHHQVIRFQCRSSNQNATNDSDENKFRVLIFSLGHIFRRSSARNALALIRPIYFNLIINGLVISKWIWI